MEDPQSVVQLFEMEQSLEMDESSSEAAAVVAEREWDSDFFKHELEGGLAAEIHQRANSTEVLQRAVNFSDAVTERTHFEAEESSEVLAKLADEESFFAPMTKAEEQQLAKSVSLLDVLKSSPEYLRARQEFVNASIASDHTFEKRCSSSEKTPKACGPGMIRCGENTAKVERAGNFVTEYDENGNLLRGYSLED